MTVPPQKEFMAKFSIFLWNRWFGSVKKIKAENLLDNMWAEFPDFNPRLQHKIISLQAHYKPTGSEGMCRAPTPKTREHILQEMANQLYSEDLS
jgi:hypothetical protein